MGRKPARLKWFKFYFDKYLDGSTSRELTSSERGVFVGLLSLAARANNHGWIDADMESLPRLLDAPGPVVQRTLEKCQAPGPDGEPKIHIDGHRVQVVKFDEYNPERWERQLYDSRHETTNNVDNVVRPTNDSKTRPDQTRREETRKEKTPHNPPKVLKTSFGEEGTVKMTQEEYDKLLTRFGESDAKVRIQHLEDYILSKGKKYASHYRTILVWAEKDGQAKPSDPEWDRICVEAEKVRNSLGLTK